MVAGPQDLPAISATALFVHNGTVVTIACLGIPTVALLGYNGPSSGA
ncbi:hypothetical protein [Haloarchaeobius sp. FL176]|mgnify:CR=1 FL=1|nr:hypothetical protein [Haloarchaeobius sp. FL176]